MNLREFIQSEIKSALGEDFNLDQAFNDAKPVEEGVMSELDILAKEAKDLKSFVKTVFKEFDNLPKNNETLKWLEGIYKDSKNESVNEEFKSEYEGNDGIIWKKGKSRGGVTNFTPYYKGHDIDKGGHNFKTEKELKNFIKDYILSNQLYNKYRFESVNESDIVGQLAGDSVHHLIKAIGPKFVSGEIKNTKKDGKTYLKLTDEKFGSGVVKILKSRFGIDAKVDYYGGKGTFAQSPSVSFYSDTMVTESEEQLDEKLITFSNRASYGQIVFMAGGAGSGKGFAIDNFIDAAGFKVRDVDEMKTALAKLDKLGKFSVDRWYKKYGKNLSDKPGKDGGLSPKAHIEEFVLGKGMSIADIADVNHKDKGLKNPNNVASLHYIVDAMGLKDKWVINMLSGKTNKETLPNLLFDITAKKVSSITDVIKPLVDAGYDSKNIHLIWVLTKYSIAVEQNKERDRVVPADIQLDTHEGASTTIWSVLTKQLPKGLNGRIDVILNNMENTLYYRIPSLRGSRKVNGKDKEDTTKIGNSKSITGKAIKVGVVSGFKSLPIKKQGGGIIPEKDWKVRLYNWIKKNAPKTLVYGKDMDISRPEKEDK